MKILYFDCFSGISGDMTIGALLDLGINRERFLNELSKLKLDGFKIEIGTKTVNGISGTDVNVVLTDDTTGYEHEHGHDHEHDHGHEHEHGHDHEHEHEHGHDHEHEHGHDHEHDHGHEHNHEHNHDHAHGHTHDHNHVSVHTHGERGLAEIEYILDQSSLSENIKDFSKKVFREIAAAEAKVHGKPVSEVHFHEVGAIDSIVDIAGTAICLELLGVEKVYSSALHDGSGFIECRHGIIPVPVPAVMEMLAGSGIPLISEEVGTELVTPTGMGLIKSLAAVFGSMPAMRIEKTGYGLGKRNTGRLNALRVILGETLEGDADTTVNTRVDLTAGKTADLTGTTANITAGKTTDTTTSTTANKAVINSTVCRDEIIVLETNIDDTTSEILGYTMTKLLEAGALDVFYTPVFMKKNRPAYMLTVLAKPGSEDMLAEIILAETSTLGIRMNRMERYCMERTSVQVKTEYGVARVKIASFRNIKKAAPEFEDCRKIAQETGLPLLKVYETVKQRAIEQVGL